jgi:hypothetical protein
MMLQRSYQKLILDRKATATLTGTLPDRIGSVTLFHSRENRIPFPLRLWDMLCDGSITSKQIAEWVEDDDSVVTQHFRILNFKFMEEELLEEDEGTIEDVLENYGFVFDPQRERIFHNWQVTPGGVPLFHQTATTKMIKQIRQERYSSTEDDGGRKTEMSIVARDVAFDGSLGSYTNIPSRTDVQRVVDYLGHSIQQLMNLLFRLENGDTVEFSEYVRLRYMSESKALNQVTVVGLDAGEISLDTSRAACVSVISTDPFFLGPKPEATELHKYRAVAMVGKVEVPTVGVVFVGNWIVASGRNDGLAVSRSALKKGDKVIGIATTHSFNPSIKMIVVLLDASVGREAKDKHLIRLVQDNARELNVLRKEYKSVSPEFEDSIDPISGRRLLSRADHLFVHLWHAILWVLLLIGLSLTFPLIEIAMSCLYSVSLLRMIFDCQADCLFGRMILLLLTILLLLLWWVMEYQSFFYSFLKKPLLEITRFKVNWVVFPVAIVALSLWLLGGAIGFVYSDSFLPAAPTSCRDPLNYVVVAGTVVFLVLMLICGVIVVVQSELEKYKIRQLRREHLQMEEEDLDAAIARSTVDEAVGPSPKKLRRSKTLSARSSAKVHAL